jgi:hypothetical protein
MRYYVKENERWYAKRFQVIDRSRQHLPDDYGNVAHFYTYEAAEFECDYLNNLEGNKHQK